jgi:mRNA interferase RelE/StbE
MAYDIIWSPKSKEGLKSLAPELARRIILKVDGLRLAPYHFVERLVETNCWKMRVGDQRIILDIDEKKKEINVLKIGHRKNIYK